jgi:hypothetical protein
MCFQGERRMCQVCALGSVQPPVPVHGCAALGAHAVSLPACMRVHVCVCVTQPVGLLGWRVCCVRRSRTLLTCVPCACGTAVLVSAQAVGFLFSSQALWHVRQLCSACTIRRVLAAGARRPRSQATQPRLCRHAATRRAGRHVLYGIVTSLATAHSSAHDLSSWLLQAAAAEDALLPPSRRLLDPGADCSAGFCSYQNMSHPRIQLMTSHVTPISYNDVAVGHKARPARLTRTRFAPRPRLHRAEQAPPLTAPTVRHQGC